MAITKLANSQINGVDIDLGSKTFAAFKLGIGGPVDPNYISKFMSANADNFNAFVSTAGTGEYGIYDNALYFQALTLSNGIRFYGNNTAPNPGLQINASNNVIIQSALNLTPLTASTALALDASKNVVSVTNTGTGSNVLGAGPTLSGLILAAGSTTVAPLKFTSGTNKTTAAAGEFEYNGTSLFFTPTGTTRQTIAYLGLAQTYTAQQSGTTPTAKDSTTKFATTAYVGKQFTATGSGTGSATSIVIAHGVSGVTTASSVIVTPNNAASAGISYVTIDATNVTIVYAVAPVTGTNNLAYSISIK